MAYEPNCLTESRVYVNDTRLPAGDVDVRIRKEGPLDMGRYAEVQFATPFRGEDFLQYFNVITGEQSETPQAALPVDKKQKNDILRVDLYDEGREQYVPSFHGIVTGLGNSPSDNERMWQVRGQGVGLLLDKIYAGEEYGKSNVTDILNDVQEALSKRLSIPIEIGSGNAEDEPVQDIVIGEGVYDPRTNPQAYQAAKGPFGFGAATFNEKINTHKTFKANKNTLADIINWVRDKAGVRIWLEPTPDGVTFIATKEPTRGSHKAHYLDGDVGVVENNALSEIQPANTITVHGKAKSSLEEYGEFELNLPAKQFSSVKARHPVLYQRAGNVELSVGPIESTAAEEEEEVENEAKSKLKEHIDRATGGDMDCLLAGGVKPYDTIEALPTCRKQPSTDLEPVTYEISRVHHKVRASDSSRSILNVGIWTPLEDIEIVRSWQEDA